MGVQGSQYIMLSVKNLIKLSTSFFCITVFAVNLPVLAKAKDREAFYEKYAAAVKQEKLGNRLQAVKNFQAANQLDRKDFSTLMKLGMLHLNSDAQGELKTKSDKLALEYFSKARSLRPEDTLANLMLGKTYEELGEKDQAIKYFTAASNLDPDNVLLKENLGRIFFENKDFKNAIEIFNKIVLAYPDNLKARSYLGASLQSTDNYLSAIEQYNYVLNYTPDEYSIVKNIGDSWLAVNQLDKAGEHYAKALEIDPNVPNLYADLAFIARQKKDYEDAIKNYKKALDLKDNDKWQRALAYSYWSNQEEKEAIAAFDKIGDYAISGFIYQNLGDLNKAIASYEKSLETNPKDHKIRFNLAQIYHSQNNLDKARREYEKLLEQKPNDTEVVFLLASIRQEQGDIDAAMAYYKEIIDLENLENSPDIKLLKNNSSYNMGLAYKSQQKLEKAEKSFEQLLDDGAQEQRFSKSRDVFKELSFIKIALGKNAEAEKLINGWLKEDPTSIEARNLYADYLVHVSKERQAVEQLRLASALDKTTETRLKLANLLHAQNNLYDALAEYQTVLQEEPKNLNALLGAANNFKSLGFKDEAINMYRQTLEAYPNDVLANYNYGLLMQEAKNLELAKEHYEKVLSLDPNFTQTYYVLGLVYWDLGEKEEARSSWNKFMSTSADETLKQAIKQILNAGGTDPNAEIPRTEAGKKQLSHGVQGNLIEVKDNS